MGKLHDVQIKFFSNSTELARQVAAWKSNNEKVVFTNGCFDILHQGHVTYLAQAADFGTKLIVGLNTDASVRLQGKGEERPINPELARAFVLAGLGFVDAVILFDAPTPESLIEELKPSVLVKGADYDENQEDPKHKQYIVGREKVLAYGGDVRTVDLVPGFSTTNIVSKLKKA
ncbi:MAG TPA: adenylyltransferase/cytidyltransferase family protein [Fluviicola sp.]|nr:adenylyltransferase/cytidyltransferase family protein [Fluviicola sp.]